MRAVLRAAGPMIESEHGNLTPTFTPRVLR
jgi:hypothetical protein